MKAIQIALLYWLRQTLRLFCPHLNTTDSRDYHAPVCPNCALDLRLRIKLDSICGWKAVSQRREQTEGRIL